MSSFWKVGWAVGGFHFDGRLGGVDVEVGKNREKY